MEERNNRPMITITQKEKAIQFRQLHSGPKMLVLPNAWDAASARILAQAGFPAIATTSSGVAAALGYPKGQQRTLDDIAAQIELLKTIQAVAAEMDIPLVINARTDIYLLPGGDPASKFEQAVQRGRAYREAGADCFFPIGLTDAPTIATLVKAVAAPVNILSGPHAPSLPELADMGVARVSFGGGLMRAALGHLRRVADELLTSGTYASMEAEMISSKEFREMFE